MKRFGLVPHHDRPQAGMLARQAAAWLTERGLRVSVPASEAGAVGLGEYACDVENFASEIDVAISLGGDGTMLRAVALVSAAGVPVLGVNVGQMGYLTAVEPDSLVESLPKLIADDFQVEERLMLEIEVVSSGSAAGNWLALNEAVVEKTQHGRLVRLGVWINGAFFTTYAADGAIISTPTGSTAYSYSAGGPIVSPTQRCMVLTPVAPHMLFDRSLVLGANEELRLEVGDDRPVELVIDGREIGELSSGDAVTCTGAPAQARIVGFGTRAFHQVLKAKFGLADR